MNPCVPDEQAHVQNFKSNPKRDGFQVVTLVEIAGKKRVVWLPGASFLGPDALNSQTLVEPPRP